MKKILLALLFISNQVIAEQMVTNKYDIIFEDQQSKNAGNIHQGYNLKDYKDVPPAKTKGELFKECILKSDKRISVLEKLKEKPEKERVSILYKSLYWKNLNEEEQIKTLKILAKLTGVSETQYVIIKGKLAESFKEECIAIAK